MKSEDADLDTLAFKIYILTRRSSWLGGTVPSSWRWREGEHATWPRGLEKPDWSSDCFWSLSPEIELGGHRLRLCVSSYNSHDHAVRVFVDDEVKYPGGVLRKKRPGIWTQFLRFWVDKEIDWSFVIAEQERRDGGKSGPVYSRDLLIKEASKEIKRIETGVRKNVTPRSIEDDPHYKAALEELSALSQSGREG